MRSVVKWLVIFGLIIIGSAYALPSFIDINAYKEPVAKALGKSAMLAFNIEGEMSLTILPRPKLTLTEVTAEVTDSTIGQGKLFKAREIVVGIPLMALLNLAGGWNPKQLIITEADCEYQDFLGYWQQLKQHVDMLNIPRIELQRGVIRDYEDGYALKSLNAEVLQGGILSSHNISVQANFELKDQEYAFEFDVSDLRSEQSGTLQAALHTNKGTLRLQGESKNLLAEPSFKGTVSLDMQSIIGAPKQNGAAKSNVANAIPLKLSADLDLKPGMGIVNNIKVESDKVHDVDAVVQLDLSERVDVKVKAKVASVELGESSSIKAPQEVRVQQDKVAEVNTVLVLLQGMVDNFNLEIPHSLVATIELQIDKMLYRGQELTNLVLDADAMDEIVSINKLEADIPGKSHFTLKGNISHNNIRPKLEGTLSFISSDLQALVKWLMPDVVFNTKTLGFSSDILLTPHHLSLHNIDAAVDNMLFKGSLSAYHNTKTRMSINSTIELANIDANAFGLDTAIDNQIFNLFISDYDKTGETFTTITDDMRWLRSFPVNWSCDLDLSNLRFKDYDVERLFLSFNIESNHLLLSRVILDSELAKLNGSMHLTLPSFRPRLEGELSFDYIDDAIAGRLFGNFDKLRERLKSYSAEKGVPKGYVDTDLNFFGANQYDSMINVKVDTWKHNDDILTDLNATIISEGGTFGLQDFRAKGFDGEIAFNTNMTVSTPVPSFSSTFSLNNVNPQRLFALITGVDKIAGYASLSGKMSATAQTINGMYSNLNGEAKFIGRKIVWDGFGLEAIISNTEGLFSLNDKIKQITYYVNTGKSSFDSVTGDIKVASGVADLSNFTIATSRSSGVMVGKYDMLGRRLNSISKFSFIPIGDTNPLTLQIQSKGNIANPEVQVDYDSITKYITSRTVDTQDAGGVESLLQGRRKEQ